MEEKQTTNQSNIFSKYLQFSLPRSRSGLRDVEKGKTEFFQEQKNAFSYQFLS